jgi:hypothetical protein
MPTLDPTRRAASAYPPRFSGSNMQKAAQVAALVVGIFFLHNIIFHVSLDAWNRGLVVWKAS